MSPLAAQRDMPRLSSRRVIGDQSHRLWQYSARRPANAASSTHSPAMPRVTASSPSTVRFSIMNRIACS